MEPITLEEMKAVKLMNRTDTKFVTNQQMLMQLLQLVDDQYFIQHNNGKDMANYHTLYFDTMDNSMYIQHHNGHKSRQKLRIRSYVDSDLHFLEIKTKDNHGRTKKKRESLDFSRNEKSEKSVCNFFGDELMKCYPLSSHLSFLNELLWLDPLGMQPKIENNFSRITLVNKGKTERLTIDMNLGFHNIETGNSINLDNIVIVELKRDSLQPSPILPVLNQLRIFTMGFSKYCIGMALTNSRLKQNRFKERLRMIERISNN